MTKLSDTQSLLQVTRRRAASGRWGEPNPKRGTVMTAAEEAHEFVHWRSVLAAEQAA